MKDYGLSILIMPKNYNKLHEKTVYKKIGEHFCK